MGRVRVVDGGQVRLPLSENDYIDVKRELNAGEYWDLLEALGSRQKFARILAYVISWSFVGLDGQPLRYDVDDPVQARCDTIGALDKATLREVTAALDKHETAQDQALAKKKAAPATPSGARVSATT